MSDSESVGRYAVGLLAPSSLLASPDGGSAAGESWDFKSLNKRRGGHIAAAEVWILWKLRSLKSQF